MRTRPARSVSTFSHLPAGEGATPAVQMTTLLAIRSPPTTTPSASIWSTLCPKRTSTPRFSNRRLAASESSEARVPKTRGAMSTSTMRVAARLIRRNSAFKLVRTRTASDEASSTQLDRLPLKQRSDNPDAGSDHPLPLLVRTLSKPYCVFGPRQRVPSDRAQTLQTHRVQNSCGQPLSRSPKCHMDAQHLDGSHYARRRTSRLC